MVAVCLFITLLIFSSYYYLLSSQQYGVLYKLLGSTVLTCAQIILTELSLGLFHHLYLSSVMIANLACAALALKARWSGYGGVASTIRDDVASARRSARSAFDGHAIVLAVLVFLAYAWILAAAYYLPPRGIDDIGYHLPAVFEYTRSHEIRLLPLTIPPFAYPENAELLFLWPVLFTHDKTMVDAANIPFVLLSVLTVYAMARHFSVAKNNALFVALLYALCPVVLMQAGVNYVDIIVSVFLLLSIYFSLRYSEHHRTLDITLAGLSIGLMCGMKYTAPFLALPVQILILPALRKGKWRHTALYVSIIVLAGGWWYLRNWFLLGNPLYPMQFHSSVPDGLVNLKGGSILQNIRYNLPYWIARYPLQDSGVGTYDGGFGPVFWGMCFSSWFYAAFRACTGFRRSSIPRLVVLSYLPVGFVLLLSFPPRVVDFNGRLAMFVVAIGLLAFSDVLSSIRDKIYTSVIKTLCIVLSVVTASLVFSSNQPTYRFSAALRDARDGIKSSEFKYLETSHEAHVGLRPAWELLDLLTRDDPGGFNCVLASDFALQWPSPVYGSKLQNRVLNMSGDYERPVDAYVCTYLDRSRLPALPDSKPATAMGDVLSEDSYVVAVHSDHACLLLRKDIFDLPSKQDVLLSYYQSVWPEAIELAKRLDSRLDAGIPVITDDEIGYAVRFVDMTAGRPCRVYLAVDGRVEALAIQRNMKRCYTFGRPLSGYRAGRIFQAIYKGKELEVFLNGKE